MEYELTRIGELVARCLNQPYDTSLRDEIQRVIYSVANENPRPIIFERQFNDLIDILVESISNTKIVCEVKNEVKSN